MTPEQWANEKICLILGKIKKELLLIAPDNRADFEITSQSAGSEQEIKILYMLANAGVTDFPVIERVDPSTGKPCKMMIKVNLDRFDELYNACKSSTSTAGFDMHKLLWKNSPKKCSFREIITIDAKWEDIKIKFLNNQEVLISHKGKMRQSNFEEMGFQDDRTKKPNQQWEFLLKLSRSKGEITWEQESLEALRREDILKNKKTKQLLSKTLREAFAIEGEPFYDYKKEKSYRIKIILEPESEDSVPIIDEDRLDIGSYFDEQTHLR